MLDELDNEKQIKNTSDEIQKTVEDYKQSANEMYNQTKDKVKQNYDLGVEKVTNAAQLTDKYVRENPWYAVGAAALIGVVVGVIVSSNKHKNN